MAQGDVLGFIKNRPGNLLINGAFEFNQRFGTTLNSSAGSYGLDRWYFVAGTSVARVAIASQKFDFAMECIATAALNKHKQRIESSTIKHLRGKTATFSILMKLTSGAVSAQPKIRLESADVKDDFSATTLVSEVDLESGAAIDATFQRFKKTFTITNDMADRGFSIEYGDFASATNTMQYAQAMLNENANPAPFERAGISISGELELCQRYYEKSWELDVVPGTASDYKGCIRSTAVSTTDMADLMCTEFMAKKRAVPVMTFYNPETGSTGTFRDMSAASNLGTPAVSVLGGSSLSTERFGVYSSSGALVSTRATSVHYTADAEL